MAKPTVEQELAALRTEHARLLAEKEKSSTLTMKVSEKGALSVYGLGRFPVTLYKEQWSRLMDQADNIRTFLKTNDGQLKGKDQK